MDEITRACLAIVLLAASSASITSRKERVTFTFGLFLMVFAHAPKRIVENVSAAL